MAHWSTSDAKQKICPNLRMQLRRSDWQDDLSATKCSMMGSAHFNAPHYGPHGSGRVTTAGLAGASFVAIALKAEHK